VINFFIHRPIFACSIALLMLLVGTVSILTLPISQYPDIVPGTVQVTSSYPGANAETTARVITQPLEQQINGVEGMIYLSSNSTTNGASTITVTFDVGYDLNIASVDVQNRVQTAEAQLPTETQQAGITVLKESADITLIVSLSAPDGGYDNTFLGNYAQINLMDPLSRVDGVGSITIFGLQNYSIRIWLEPEKLAALGITIDEVKTAIQNQNKDIAAGNIGQPPVPDSPSIQYQLSTLGQLQSAEQFGDIVVRANNDGSVVRIDDIGRTELGAQNYTTSTTLNQKPTATMAIYQLPGANALQVAEGIKSSMAQMAKNFPEGVEWEVTFNINEFVKESLIELVVTLLEAILLVVAVVFVFLQNWRVTLIPIIAIPVSLIATFAVLAGFGFSINLLTLLGLVLAVGLVVDDAIVVVENVERQFEAGEKDAKRAAEKAMKEVAGPIIATSLVLMAVFVPAAFMPGITGKLYNQFSLTIAFSVGLSAINSLTLSPALAGSLLKPREGETKFFLYRWFNRGFESLTNGYGNLMHVFARAWWVVMLVFGGLFFLTVYLTMERPTGFVPEEDQGWYFTIFELPPGASLSRTEAVVNKATEVILQNPSVQSVIQVNGVDFLESINVSNFGFAIAILKPWSERTTPEQQVPGIIDVIKADLDKQIEGAVSVSFNAPPIPGLGTTGGFQYQIEDINSKGPQALYDITQEFVAKAMESPVIGKAFSDFEMDYPELFMDIDRAQAEVLGVDVGSLFTTIQAYLSSIYINNYNKYGQVYQVNIMAEGSARSEPEDLARLRVTSSGGGSVPFGEFMDISYTTGPVNIPRYNLYTSTQIIGGPAPGYSGGQAIQELIKIEKSVLQPAGFGGEWTGLVYQQLIAGSYAPLIFILGLMTIFLILSALYESWAMPLMILLSVPLAVLGAIIALGIRSMPLDIYGQIGLLMLIGLAAKNAILIVEFARELRIQGRSIVESAVEAARLRIRPILMTAFAFILGVMPLVFASGAGAGARHSIGTTVFGGMIASTFLSLLLVPIFYVVIQWVRERFNMAKELRPSDAEADPAES